MIRVQEGFNDFAVRWQEFDHSNHIVTKQKSGFKTGEALQKFIDKISEKDNFYQVLTTSSPDEKAEGSEFEIDRDIVEDEMGIDKSDPEMVENSKVSKFPENILQILRQMKDYDENDSSHDDEFESYSPAEAFDEWLSWEGTGESSDHLVGIMKDCGYTISENR